MESPAVPPEGERGSPDEPQPEDTFARRLTPDAERFFIWPVLLPHLVRSAVFLVPVVVSLLFWLVGTGFSILAGLGAVGGRGLELGPAIDSGLSLLGVGGMVVFGMAWLVSLFVGVREVVSEAGLLIEDGAQALATVYSSLQARLETQRPSFTVRSSELDKNPALRISNDREEALIIVRPTGPDLHIGWTMWRTRSTTALIVDMFPGRRNNDLALLQAHSSSAMRELLHSAIEHSARKRTS